MTSAAAGPFFVVAALACLAGVAKLVRPASTAAALRGAGLPGSALLARALGGVEIALGTAAVLAGGRPLALLVAALYVGFAAFTIRLVARQGTAADCGCFGPAPAPVSNLHVALDLGAAGLAIAAAVAPTDGVPSLLGDHPVPTLLLIALVVVGTWLGRVLYTLLPDLLAAVHPPAGDHDGPVGPGVTAGRAR